mmetsp:Transcript_55814/g.150355  ORF Transcript_55814/g.150355 Transcript_55814/m.150355 type:complete len:448 (-) Transcript_55814:90-1433(-)
MRVSHCVLMGLLLLYTLPWSGSRVVLFYSWTGTLSMFGRMFLNFMHLEIRVSIWTNVAFSLSFASCFRQIDHPMRTQFLMNEFGTVVALIVISLAFEVSFISNARREVKERSMHGQRSAVASLLNMVCDAVVELDDELRMVADCLASSNALFHGQARGLLGKPLKQFVVGADQLFYEEKMASQDESSTDAAKMFHVRLCDAWGNSVPMELFHVPFRGMGGEILHLVGFKEHGDARADVPETGHSVGESFPSMPLAPMARAPRSVHGSASARDCDGLQVDVLAVEPMQVAWASPKFIKKYGSVDTFEELLPNPQEFRQWLNGNADAVCSGRQSRQAFDFGGLVVGRGQREQLRLVQALFVHPHELNRGVIGATDRPTYRVSIRLAGRLSGGSDTSSNSSRGTSASLGRLSLAHEDRIQEGPAHGAGGPSLPLEPAQQDVSVRQGVVSM